MIEREITFSSLVSNIQHVHAELEALAGKAVNISLTLRNWIIGYYIREYEQNGSDRAEYGKKLLSRLAVQLADELDKCYSERYIRLCRQLFDCYPQIQKSVISESRPLGIRKSVISELDPRCLRESETPKLMVPGKTLVEKLSFTHLAELIKIDNDLTRTFYEVECIKGCWSVRELKRQIASLYYERSGLSKDKEKLAELVQSGAEAAEPKLAIRDPYIFEFLGLKPKEVMGESDLEDGLLDKLQEFLLELGHGFCFEDRQKRILIGDTYGFIDLVFYHRILKCHVLIDLKLEKFSHENIGQLNTYVSWYKKNMMTEGDNPPVGLLLCTQKDHPLVEYALAGMDNHLFVSKYQLELPKTEQLQNFLEEQIKELETANDQ
jgi:predicted nuclease of restriction endonuclease-like (RecB) superfamily